MSSSSPPTPPTPPPTPTPPAPADWSAEPPPAVPFVNYSPGGSDLPYTPGPRSPAPPPPANAPLGDSSSLSSSLSSAASSQQTQQDQDTYRGRGAFPSTEVWGIRGDQSPPAQTPYLVPSPQTGDAYNAGQSSNPPPSQPPPVAAPTPQGAPPAAAAVIPPALAGVTVDTAGAAGAADAFAAAQAAAAAGGTGGAAGSAATVVTEVAIETALPATLITPAVPTATGITGGALAAETAGGALAVEGSLAFLPPVAVGLAVTGAVVGAYYGIPALARAIEADKLSPDYPSAGLPGPVDPIPMELPGGVGGGAPMTAPAAGTGPPEILPGGTADPQPQVAPGTGGPAVSAVGWQYWQAVLGRSGLTVDPVTGEVKEVSGVLHVDHIVSRSRIELYLEVTYPGLTAEQIADIANMEENLQNLEPRPNTQKGPLSYQEWNDMRVANGVDPPLDPGYLAEMQEIEDLIWALVDERAQMATYGGGQGAEGDWPVPQGPSKIG
jgi:hypothetical protein